MPATIRDVALLAGVSNAAVSKVLNNTDNTIRVSEPTRKRIASAIKKLNYRPNIRARYLFRGSTQTVAFITDRDTISVPYAHLILEQCVECLLRHAYITTALLYRTGDEDALARIAAMIEERRFDGVLFVANDVPQLLHATAHSEVPAIHINPPHAHPHDSVVFDEYDNVRLAFACLLEAGHQRIGYIDFTKGNATHATVSARRNAYLRLCHTHRLSPVFLSETYAEIDAARTPHDLAAVPAGVITYSDAIAQKFVAHLYRNRAINPQYFSIISAATDMFQDRAPLRISGVALPIEVMAETAVTQLLHRIAHKGQHVKTSALAGTLVLRESVHRAPARPKPSAR